MKAVVATAYGSPEVLQLQDVLQPTPKEDEVLIRIHTSTVTAGDVELRAFKLPWFVAVPMRLFLGVRKPRKGVLGQELAGVVEAVGANVTRFKVGDAVYAAAGVYMGAHAEAICLPETPKDGAIIGIKPANMSDEEAAAVPLSGMIASGFLKQGELKRGQKILINGAGGSIGNYTVQIAHAIGAEVTAVDSADKFDMLRSIGADHVIDYKKEDFTKSGKSYDVILDVIGKRPFAHFARVLKPDGVFLSANPSFRILLRALWNKLTGGRLISIGGTSVSNEDLATLTQMIEAGQVKTVIDRRFPLEQIADAHRYAESGRKKGNIIITVV